ncbi:cobalt ECF transporter T component CbiQ [Rummeliibacillus pycnus]|uniref:cobalt ECF transporter T component CbiQ n=1 Tax=Rummeliibacillus pycnus TaxID=101070 RepID=UPI003D293545
MLLIDQYAYINRLAKTHPVEKIVLALFLLLFSLTVKDALISLITFFLMSSLTVLVAKIPWQYYSKLLCIPGVFLLSSMISILLSFTQHPELIHSSIWQSHLMNWTVYISAQSVEMSIQLFFSVLSSISCLYFLTLTTPVHELMHVLKKCKVPQLLIELIELTYRFIFVFLEKSVQIFQSQNSRLGYLSVKLGMHSLGLLISSLFVHVFKRSKELSIAMNSRGYDESIIYLEDSYQYSARNWTIILMIFLVIIVVFIQFGGILV